MQAMLFAAGLGTRLQPLTNSKPKALVEINGKSLLERSLENLKSQGISDVVINVHHYSDQLIDFLKQHNHFEMNIQISDESDELLDTGGGILNAGPLFNPEDPILILNVDVLTNLSFRELLYFHQHEKALATLVVRSRETSRYLLFDGKRQLTGWKNKQTGATKISRPEQFPQSTPYAFSGIQIIQPDLLKQIREQGKFSVIDLYLRLAKTEVIKAFVDEESVWMDLGKYEQMGEAERLVKQLEQDSK
ncbi:nucleotidyltransferase family protein [uncultured Sunxiuqinia sp.]|uniref:nucleotidyltransferase family protein n=1 Tax=uncultured Sunxiuqinia sp. TaxID=1573825 RepID=UPI0030D918A1|tara:strand:- start:20811 stop:21554 length:744 start_codon:yes stop_codon:yes gene_type:complete